MPKSSLILSQGNRKIKNCNIFNLPVGTTCKPGVLCSSYCYAKKAEKMYKTVRPARMRNYKESKRVDFISKMIELLSKSKYKVTRIHEAGDFYNKEYIAKWYQIARALPKYKFYAYTKRDDLFDKTNILFKPDNLTLIYSIDGVWSDTDIIAQDNIGWDKFAVVREHKTNCPSTAKDGWKKACIRDCVKCINKTTLIINFAKH